MLPLRGWHFWSPGVRRAQRASRELIAIAKVLCRPCRVGDCMQYRYEILHCPIKAREIISGNDVDCEPIVE